jgi:hypothetical protein
MTSKGNTRREFLKNSGLLAAAGASVGMGFEPAPRAPLSSAVKPTKHVLLISVDGIHARDLQRYVETHPGSTLAELSENGITYTQAYTRPSDSFPGLTSLVTGGSPNSTGIWYDVAFDRDLLGPGGVGGPGTVTTYHEAIDPDDSRLDGGAFLPATPDPHLGLFQFTPGQGINPAALPVGPAGPVMPWKFLRVNTIFEVAKAHGHRTAWADKHVGAYQIVHGQSGDGCEDYYSPEINSLANQLVGGLPVGSQFTNSHLAIKVYDEIKVKAVVNQCKGMNSTGTAHVGIPGIFGMNFQALSVGQKTWSAQDSALLGGYLDADGTPNTAIASALDFVDESLGDMVNALKAHGALHKTTIILSAKHGQSPINLQKRRIVPASALDAAIQTVLTAADYAVTADDAAYIWLKHSAQPKTEDVVKALWASTKLNNLPAQADPNAGIPGWLEPAWPANPGFEEILWGDTLKLRFNDPLKDSRTPDIIGLPTPGIIWAGAHSAKLAEHGGLAQDDANVALLVSNPGLVKKTLKTPVRTTQIAPTILKLLGIDPDLLESVQKEKTDELPLFDS